MTREIVAGITTFLTMSLAAVSVTLLVIEHVH
jgi:hypothetical protein